MTLTVTFLPSCLLSQQLVSLESPPHPADDVLAPLIVLLHLPCTCPAPPMPLCAPGTTALSLSFLFSDGAYVLDSELELVAFISSGSDVYSAKFLPGDTDEDHPVAVIAIGGEPTRPTKAICTGTPVERPFAQ